MRQQRACALLCLAGGAYAATYSVYLQPDCQGEATTHDFTTELGLYEGRDYCFAASEILAVEADRQQLGPYVGESMNATMVVVKYQCTDSSCVTCSLEHIINAGVCTTLPFPSGKFLYAIFNSDAAIAGDSASVSPMLTMLPATSQSTPSAVLSVGPSADVTATSEGLTGPSPVAETASGATLAAGDESAAANEDGLRGSTGEVLSTEGGAESDAVDGDKLSTPTLPVMAQSTAMGTMTVATIADGEAAASTAGGAVLAATTLDDQGREGVAAATEEGPAGEAQSAESSANKLGSRPVTAVASALSLLAFFWAL